MSGYAAAGAWGAMVGSLMLAADGAVIVVLETIARWWWSRRRPDRACLAAAPSGVGSTALLRSRAALVTPWAAAVGLTGWCLLMVVLAAHTWWLAASFGALALGCTARLAPLVLGRAKAGGVYLTPAGVETRWGVRTVAVPLDEIPTAGGPFPLRRSPHATEVPSFAVDMPTDVVDRAGRDEVAVPMPYLALARPELVALVELGQAERHLRDHFGTPRSLERHLGTSWPRTA